MVLDDGEGRIGSDLEGRDPSRRRSLRGRDPSGAVSTSLASAIRSLGGFFALVIFARRPDSIFTPQFWG
jgi:hypothetical protein